MNEHGQPSLIQDATELERRLDDPRTVLHWYDFLCPFCYVGQSRNEILARHGLDIVELPFQAHPDIPPEGIAVGPREGRMYDMLELEARQAGLPLNWPARLPDTHRALAVAEWTRRNQPAAFDPLIKAFFAAHFALGEDLGDPAVIDRHVNELGVDLGVLHGALADGSAAAAVTEASRLARRYRVQGTPAWLVSRQMISGLLPGAEFERLAKQVMQAAQ
jgi:predicted DsbA family dithiol-disulfide isomerase